jgi:prepilin-type N-terminal cleavage/methylation domain-containing protein
MKRMVRRGFTLPEQIIVLFVLALIAAFGAPRLSAALRNRTTQTDADNFVAAHSLARATAVRYGRVAQFHIDPTTARYWVDVDTSGAGIGQRAIVWYTRDASVPGLTLTSNRTLVCFDSRGLASTIGTCQGGDIQVIFAQSGHADTVRTTTLGKVLR